jgi:hypothetical protein
MRTWLEVVTTNSRDESFARGVVKLYDVCLETAICPTHLMITPHSRQGLDVINVLASDKYKIGSVLGKEDLKNLLESMSQVAIIESL